MQNCVTKFVGIQYQQNFTLLSLCGGNPLVTGRIPNKGTVKRNALLLHKIMMLIVIRQGLLYKAFLIIVTNIQIRDHSESGLSQWETTLLCSGVSHWMGPYIEWSLPEWKMFTTGQPNHIDLKLFIICMMTSSNENIFRVTGPLCGEFTGSGEFPTQRPVTRSFDAFFDLRLNKPLSKQPWGWWFETLSWSLWRHRNGLYGVINNSLASPYLLQSYVCGGTFKLTTKNVSSSEYANDAFRWRHNERDGVSNQRRLGCVLNHLFGFWSKKTSKLRVTGDRTKNQ